jgi:hypothetical protein
MHRLVAVLFVLAVASHLSAEEPREILERAVKAHGGAEALERCRTSAFSFKAQSPAQMEFACTGEWRTQLPDRQKIQLTITEPKFDVVMVINGGKCWSRMSVMGNAPMITELPQEQSAEIEGLLHESHIRSLVPVLREARFTLGKIPEETIKGQPAVAIKVSCAGKPDVSLYFDKETHLLVKSSYRTTGPTGGPREMLFDDYRLPTSDDESKLQKAGIKVDGETLRTILAKQQADPNALEKARALVKRLGDEAFEVREKASNDLVALGVSARPALQEAAKDEDLEIARRATLCLEKIQERTNIETSRAAIRLLTLRSPDEAPAVLLAMLPGVEEPVGDEIREALVWLVHRPGGPNPVLTRAVDDADPVKRAAVRAVLGKDGGAYLDRPNRRLLVPEVVVPYRRIMKTDGPQEMVFNVTEFHFLNRIDDKEFEKP